MKNNSLRIVIRVDSSNTIGTGHVSRCLTLANMLHNFGCEILFISREHHGHIIEKLEASTHKVYRLPVSCVSKISLSNDYSNWLGVTIEEDALSVLNIINKLRCDWIIVDHYSLNEIWEKIVRPAVNKILVIDDLANRNHDCDVLLDQNYFNGMDESRYKHRVTKSCTQLLGPNYALLQPEYAHLASITDSKNGNIQRVLIFFGGSDLTDQTGKVFHALCHPLLNHLSVDVVIGANYSDPEGLLTKVKARSKAILYSNLPTLAYLMVNADLMIGAGGSTTWERMCLGIPSIIVSVAENQQYVTQALCSDGYQKSPPGGMFASSNDWVLEISNLMQKPWVLLALSNKSRQLVDGLGSQRLVDIILENRNG